MKNLNVKLWTFSVSAFLCLGVINVSNHGFRMLQEPEVKINVAEFDFYENSIIASVYIKEKGSFRFSYGESIQNPSIRKAICYAHLSSDHAT